MKDAKVIEQLVKDGRYAEPTIPQGVFAEVSDLKDYQQPRQIVKLAGLCLKKTHQEKRPDQDYQTGTKEVEGYTV